MKRKERTEHKFLKRIKSDYTFRTFVFSAFSFLVTVAFTGYNVFLAVVYRSAWNIGIAIYYALLLCVRAYVIFFEYEFNKKNIDDRAKENARKQLYLVQSILLLVMDIALIAPISIMVMQQKDINYSEIPALTIAAYTTYKITAASINIVKTRKGKHLSVKILRNVNFVDALVSVLSLQYTLIMTFGGGIDGKMRTLCAISTFFIWMFIIFISVLSFIHAVKSKKDKQDTERSE